MMNDKIQTLWIGPHLSRIERVCLQSFLVQGHEVTLWAYRNIENVPKGITIRNAENIISWSSASKIIKRVPIAIFSDLFRWKMLNLEGGWWVDADIFCIKEFDFPEEYAFSRDSFRAVSNAVIKAPKGSKLGEEMIAQFWNPCRPLPTDGRRLKLRKKILPLIGRNHPSYFSWGEATGPLAFSGVIKMLGMEKWIQSHLTFYPVSHNNWDAIFDSTFAGKVQFHEKTCAIHLWNEYLGRNKIHKDQKFAPDSLFETLIRNMGIK